MRADLRLFGPLHPGTAAGLTPAAVSPMFPRMGSEFPMTFGKSVLGTLFFAGVSFRPAVLHDFALPAFPAIASTAFAGPRASSMTAATAADAHAVATATIAQASFISCFNFFLHISLLRITPLSRYLDCDCSIIILYLVIAQSVE